MNGRIGVDLGGTKIEALALDGDGREVFRKRVPTPRGDYSATISSVRALVRDAGEGSVGVGIPGAESQATGLIKNANSTWLIGKPLRQDLEAALGRPVRLENDANCFALSEAVDGAGKGAAVVFGVILGTGVGGGIVVDGKIIRGANAIVKGVKKLSAGQVLFTVVAESSTNEPHRLIASSIGVAIPSAEPRRVTSPLRNSIAGGRPRSIAASIDERTRR